MLELQFIYSTWNIIHMNKQGVAVNFDNKIGAINRILEPKFIYYSWSNIYIFRYPTIKNTCNNYHLMKTKLFVVTGSRYKFKHL